MSNADPQRRQFLSFCTSALMAVIGLLVIVPAVVYLFAPLRKKRGRDAGGTFLDVGPLTDFPVGEWRPQTVRGEEEEGWRRQREVGRKRPEAGHGIWVRRDGPGDDQITVLSSICPHLGCPINWHADQARFQCPCHGGVFNAEGGQISGPPPRSMDRLPFQVRAGRLWVRWQDFKIGVAERIPLSG
jgi:Rieske Fe-S protein